MCLGDYSIRAQRAIVIAACGCTFLFSILLVSGSLQALASKGFREAALLVQATSSTASATSSGDATTSPADEDVPQHDVDLILFAKLLLICGCIALGGSVVGVVAVLKKSKSFLGVYAIAVLFNALAFGAGGVQLTNLMLTFGPSMERQMAEFCQPDMTALLKYELATQYEDTNCGAADRPGAPILVAGGAGRRLEDAHLCGAMCQRRLPVLQAMGGCKTLSYLCEKQTADGQPKMLQRFFLFADRGALLLFAFSAISGLAWICSLMLLYTLVTGRQGKKGLNKVLGRLLCPCWLGGGGGAASRGGFADDRKKLIAKDGFEMTTIEEPVE